MSISIYRYSNILSEKISKKLIWMLNKIRLNELGIFFDLFCTTVFFNCFYQNFRMLTFDDIDSSDESLSNFQWNKDASSSNYFSQRLDQQEKQHKTRLPNRFMLSPTNLAPIYLLLPLFFTSPGPEQVWQSRVWRPNQRWPGGVEKPPNNAQNILRLRPTNWTTFQKCSNTLELGHSTAAGRWSKRVITWPRPWRISCG